MVCVAVAIALMSMGGAPVAANGPTAASVMSGSDDLIWGTFLGGTSSEYRALVAVDSAGAVYVAGNTQSSDLPATVGSYDTTFNGDADVFVAKLSADGTSLDYLTYLGGSGSDQVWGLAVDDNGVAYVCGVTASNDFPIATWFYDSSYNGSGDAFVTAVAANARRWCTPPISGAGVKTWRIHCRGRQWGGLCGRQHCIHRLSRDARSFNGGPVGGSRDAFVATFAANGSAHRLLHASGWSEL
jgi:hypothetical protein